jgi:hypothetical protein
MSDKLRINWTINGLLAVILVLLCGYYFQTPMQKAHAGTGWDTNGIMAMTTAANESLVLVDTAKQNIMVYKATQQKFRLIGARSYKYDVEVDDTEGTSIVKGNGATFIDMMKFYNTKDLKK